MNYTDTERTEAHARLSTHTADPAAHALLGELLGAPAPVAAEGLTLDLKALRDGLKRAAAGMEARAKLPLLKSVELHGAGGTLTLRTTDLDTYTTVRVVAAGSLPACRVALTELAKLLKGKGEAVLSLDGTALVIEAGGARMRLPLVVIEDKDLPAPAWGEPQPLGELPGFALAELLGVVAPAMSSDLARPSINCVRLATSPEGVRAVARDGHRLHLADFGAALPASELLLNPSTVSALLACAGSEAVTVTTSIPWVTFTTPTWTVAGRLVDETYPAYPQVLELIKDTNTVEWPRVAVLDALKRLGKRPRVTLGGGSLRAGDDVVVWSNDATPIAPVDLNPAYLRDALEALRGEHVRVRWADELSPVGFTSTTHEGVLCVVSPMRRYVGAAVTCDAAPETISPAMVSARPR